MAVINSICANCHFPFPNHFWNELSRRVIPILPEISAFDPDIMKFKLMNLIPKYLSAQGFENLKRYLQDDSTGIMLYQISGMIADLFDQYLVFRPEMILSWEEGVDDHWQAIMWRALIKDSDSMHRLRIQNEISDKINNGSLTTEMLPRRISLFGISYLPPSYLNAFMVLSKVVQVNFFVLNPCMEYWSDIVTESERRHIQRKYDPKEIDTDDLHLEKGNRLLSSMGIMGRDFFRQIIDVECNIEEYFQDVEGKNLLTCIQSDFLHLTDSCEQNNKTDLSSTPCDGSIQIHSCHSPIREIETLNNWLLSVFEQDPDLLPKDIVVMTPDIELYAPFIEAVFGDLTGERPRIPYSIADQGVQQENKVIEGFLAILALKDSRFGSNAILSVLECIGIKERFELSESDMQNIRNWVEDTNVRWSRYFLTTNNSPTTKLMAPPIYRHITLSVGEPVIASDN